MVQTPTRAEGRFSINLLCRRTYSRLAGVHGRSRQHRRRGCRKNLRFFLLDLHEIDRFAIRTISGADPFTELGFIGLNEISLGELFASHAVPSNSARLGVSNFLD